MEMLWEHKKMGRITFKNPFSLLFQGDYEVWFCRLSLLEGTRPGLLIHLLLQQVIILLQLSLLKEYYEDLGVWFMN